MSCQSLSLAPVDPDPLPIYHRSVHFSNDGESKSMECSLDYRGEPENEGSGWSSTWGIGMSRSAPASCGAPLLAGGTGEEGGARFPRLEECAHFHYARVRLGGLTVRAEPQAKLPQHNEEDAGWVTVSVRPHSESNNSIADEDLERSAGGMLSPEQGADCSHWLITRSADNLKMLDTMLHRCIYDRKVSGLPDLSVGVDEARAQGPEAYASLIADYLHHFSIIADDTINCGPILNWFQMDNKGHRLLVASEDSSSINTPAVAAAYSVRRYVSQARDEISFEVGDMISVIDMPVLNEISKDGNIQIQNNRRACMTRCMDVNDAKHVCQLMFGSLCLGKRCDGPSESTWWRGKRGFRVGFFPQQCVAVIGDKVPRNMKQPPPIVGSVAMAPIKPVLRKHGKLISLFRSFILSRPSRRALRQQGILRERVFGCDLGEHLLNSGHDVPLVLSCCAKIIEQYGCVDGIYRLSGASSTTQRLRIAFDEERLPPLDQAPQDVHAVASLLKMYFRELPNPLCTYQLYSCFVNAVQGIYKDTTSGIGDGEEEVEVQPRRLDDSDKLVRMRDTVVKLPPPHYRTLAFLMQHLHHMSLLGSRTGMTARNMAIVWAPNLLRSPIQQHALQGVAVQAVVTEFLICYAELIFSDGQQQGGVMTPSTPDQPDSLVSCTDSIDDSHNINAAPRPKSLPLQTPTKLLSLEEARNKQQLRPSVSREPHYIEVGGGPNSLPRYHTIIQLPSGSTKRGLKRSPSGWRGLFFRASKHRPTSTSTSGRDGGVTSIVTSTVPPSDTTHVRSIVDDNIANTNCKEKDTSMVVEDSRAARSCESLLSEGDSLPPLIQQQEAISSNHHNRSVSCDSYFEASLAELAGMRLRLTSQEREMDIFSEDDTTRQAWNRGEGSSADTSAEPSPTKLPRTVPKVPSPMDTRKRTKIEEQLSDLLYIDCSTPEHNRNRTGESVNQTEYNSPDNDGEAKRVCKEMSNAGSTEGSLGSSPQSVTLRVKMRDRSSPRKSGKNGTSRHSHSGTPPSPSPKTAIAPQRHSTLIRVDWPNTDSLQPSSLNYYPYTQLESDSEASLPIHESRDSLAKRLIESKESLMSRSNEHENLISSHVMQTNLQDNHFENNSNNDIEINESPEIMVGVINQRASFENSDGSFYMLKEESESKDNLKEKRHSGIYNVDWSDGMMDSSMEKSTISSDMDKSFDGKKKCMENDNIEYENVSPSFIARNDITEEHEFSKQSELPKCSSKTKSDNVCSVTVTPSEENFSNIMIDSLEESLSPTNISYQNLNRLSNISNDSGKVGASKESTPTFSPREQERTDEIYECFTFTRPSYIHLASSSGETNTPTSPPHLKSPIKSTISITYKSPTKEKNKIIENILTINNDAVLLDDKESYEIVGTIGETATVPRNSDASLPMQQACQPNSLSENLISLDTPVNEMCHISDSPLLESKNNSISTETDIYNKVKFFRQSINEVNSLIIETETDQKDEGSFEDSLELNVNSQNTVSQNSSFQNLSNWYENVNFDKSKISVNLPSQHSYENVVMHHYNEGKNKFVGDKNISPVQGVSPDRRYNFKTSNGMSNLYENHKPLFADKYDQNLKIHNTLEHSIINEESDNSDLININKTSFDDYNKENASRNGNLTGDNSKLRKSCSNVRQLAHKFESPTEIKPSFSFDRASRSSLSHIDKISTFEKHNEGINSSKATDTLSTRNVPCIRARNNKLAKHCSNTRSLDENAFIKEFGKQALHKDHTSEREIDEQYSVCDRRKSLDVGNPKFLNPPKRLPDLNLNLECNITCGNRDIQSLNFSDSTEEKIMENEDSSQRNIKHVSVTPTTENKISLVQARLSPKRYQRQKSSNLSDSQKELSEVLYGDNPPEGDKKTKMSRERIEKYKEERRLFLREKYSPHSFRGIGDLQLSCKNKNKNDEYEDVSFEGVQLRNPEKVLERRNTTDAVQRMKYSLTIGVSKNTDKSSTDTFGEKGVDPINSISLKDCKNLQDDAPKVMYVQRKLSLEGSQSPKPERLNISWETNKIGKVNIPSSRELEKPDSIKPIRPKYLGNFGIPTSVPDSEEKIEITKADVSTSRKEKRSPSFNIKDMAAKFEQKSNPPN